MDFKSLVFDMLVEEVRNKNLLNSLFAKWKEEDPQLTIEKVEYILLNFKGGQDSEGNNINAIVEKLNPKREEVISFLERHDGNHGKLRFDPNNLKDITKYSLSQIKSLLSDFDIYIDNNEVDGLRFFEKSTLSFEQKVELSKQRWFGNENKVYDDGNGFRIYKPLNQKDSISFGYWQEHLIQVSGKGGTRWCITWTGENGRRNMWATYRSEGRTYYMVIDESKSTTDPNYISVVQPVVGDRTYPFRITNLYNSGGDRPSRMNDTDPLSCLTCIYPKLNEREVQEVLMPMEYDPLKELNVDKSIVSQVNERPGDRFEWRRMERNVKLAYINNGGVLKSMRSFEVMDEGLARAYFEKISPTKNDFLPSIAELFQSYDTFSYLISKKGFGSALNARLEVISGLMKSEVNTTMIIAEIIKNTASQRFICKQDSAVIVVESLNNQKWGLLGPRGFLKNEGIFYDLVYSELDSDYGVFDFDGVLSNDDENDQENVVGNEPEVDQNDVNTDPEMDQNDDDIQNLNEQDLQDQITYLVTSFSKSNSADDPSNFYVVHNPLDEAKVSLFTHKTWKSVGEPNFISLGDHKYDFTKPYSDIMKVATKALNEKGGY